MMVTVNNCMNGSVTFQKDNTGCLRNGASVLFIPQLLRQTFTQVTSIMYNKVFLGEKETKPLVSSPNGTFMQTRKTAHNLNSKSGSVTENKII